MEKPLAGTLAEADALIARRGAGGAPAPGRAHRALQPRAPRGRALPRRPAVHREPAPGAVPAPRHRRRGGARPHDPRPRPRAAPHRRRGGHRSAGVGTAGALSSHLDIANARVEFANGAVALATASRVSRERVRRLRALPAERLPLARPRQRRAASSCGSGATGGRAPAMRCRTSSSGSCSKLPRRTRSSSSSGASSTPCGAEREVVVSGEEGRAALALALRVAAAVRTSPLAVPAAG